MSRFLRYLLSNRKRALKDSQTLVDYGKIDRTRAESIRALDLNIPPSLPNRSLLR